jgi:hypothetical protein
MQHQSSRSFHPVEAFAPPSHKVAAKFLSKNVTCQPATIVAEKIIFHVSTWPLLAEVPVSYDATDPPLPSEEDEQGNIVPSAALDDEFADMDEPEPGRLAKDNAGHCQPAAETELVEPVRDLLHCGAPSHSPSGNCVTATASVTRCLQRKPALADQCYWYAPDASLG